MYIYQEQLFNNQLLKVNIIQCMTVGLPTVDKPHLKNNYFPNIK